MENKEELKLEERDFLILKTAKAENKSALAQAEVAELSYRNLVLQLFLKYGLTQEDIIDENGNIVKGGAVQKGE